jgi:hypothetical protein
MIKIFKRWLQAHYETSFLIFQDKLYIVKMLNILGNLSAPTGWKKDINYLSIQNFFVRSDNGLDLNMLLS